MKSTMNASQWVLLFILSLLWGGSFFFNGIAVQELPTVTIVAVRVALASAVLWVVLLLSKQFFPWKKEVLFAFLVMGFLNNMLPFTLIVWGQTYIAGGLASILNATTPMFTVVIAHLVTQDERLTMAKGVGVLTGFVGVVVLIGWEFLSATGGHVWAEVAVVMAALSYAVAGIYGRRLARLAIKPMPAATGQLSASTLFLVPIALFWDQPWELSMPSVTATAAIIALAILSTSLAYILYFRLLETAGATNLLLVTFLIPVSAIVLGVSFLDEALEVNHMIGMGLIGLGLLILDGRLIRLK